jgi:hypothetical protein
MTTFVLVLQQAYMRILNQTVKLSNISLNTNVQNVIYMQIAIKTTEGGEGGEVFIICTPHLAQESIE